MRVRTLPMLILPYVLVSLCCFAVLRACPMLRVSGGSMNPALQDGDVVVVKRSHAANEGDIALYNRPGFGQVLHRVVDVDAQGLVTKGDANRSRDLERVRPDDVEGVVVCVVPFGKAVRWWRSL